MQNFIFVLLLALLSILQPLMAETNPSDGILWNKVPGIKVEEIKEQILAKTAKVLEQVNSYGRCKESIADCLRNSSATTAGRLARDIILLVANNEDLNEVKKWVDDRRRMAHPEKVCQFDLEYLTPIGNRDAEVVIVEFSDFQCPFCAMVAPMLEDAVRDSGGKACLYLKQFPIKSHPKALIASKACVASDAFGKFWQYCNKLFENRTNLSDANLFKIAEQVGMNPSVLQQQMQRKEILDRISKEKLEGIRCRVEGTPSVFINGKKIIVNIASDLLLDRIEEELDILHGRD